MDYPRPDGHSAVFQNRTSRFDDGDCDGDSGISLRDWFAGRIAASMDLDVIDRVATRGMPAWDEVNTDTEALDEFVVPGQELARRIAVAAYRIADAMLAQRKKG